MPITIYNEADIAAQALAYLRNRFPGKASDTESFLGKLARMFAQLALGIQKAILDADRDSVPSTKSSTAALQQFAILFGLSNGAGGYGYQGPTGATGGAALCTGTLGTVFPGGALLTCPDGVTQIQLASGVTIAGAPPGNGSVAGTFSAVTLGTAGNQPIGTKLTWVTPPSGSDGTVTLTTALSGALDAETDAHALQRILQRLQNPPKGGTSADYRGWGEGVVGVSRAYPYPLRGGLGTMHLLISALGSGTSRDPGATIKTNVDSAINGTSAAAGLRAVTAQGYATLRPYQPSYPTGSLTIRLRVRPSKAKYNFDWDDTAGYTVAAFASSGGVVNNGATVTLSANAPATLTAAVDAGLKPRLQILVTSASGPVVPVQVQVIGYSGAGNRVLELQNPLPTPTPFPSAPNNGDAIYAGGPSATAIAAAVLAYIDGLGPSRAGAYADANDTWEDTADTGRIGQIALDTLDTDGSRFIAGFVQSASVNQVTIAYGNGAASTANVEASDSGAGVELLTCRFVVVTQ